MGLGRVEGTEVRQLQEQACKTALHSNQLSQSQAAANLEGFLWTQKHSSVFSTQPKHATHKVSVLPLPESPKEHIWLYSSSFLFPKMSHRGRSLFLTAKGPCWISFDGTKDTTWITVTSEWYTGRFRASPSLRGMSSPMSGRPLSLKFSVRSISVLTILVAWINPCKQQIFFH